MIAEKLRVLWHVLLGGVEKHPPAAYIPFYRLQCIGLNLKRNPYTIKIFIPSLTQRRLSFFANNTDVSNNPLRRHLFLESIN